MIFSFGSSILDTATRLLAPFIILFSLYVLVHGHDSPGGGFQGGAILAAALILIKLVRGRRAGWGFSRSWALAIACVGVLIYVGIGFLSFFFSSDFRCSIFLAIRTCRSNS